MIDSKKSKFVSVGLLPSFSKYSIIKQFLLEFINLGKKLNILLRYLRFLASDSIALKLP